MGRTACTEPQCLYKGDLYHFTFNIRECKLSKDIISLHLLPQIQKQLWYKGRSSDSYGIYTGILCKTDRSAFTHVVVFLCVDYMALRHTLVASEFTSSF